MYLYIRVVGSMKIKLTHTVTYDTSDKEFQNELLEHQDDHTLTLNALEEFIVDRFVNPNFDSAGKTTIEIVEL